MSIVRSILSVASLLSLNGCANLVDPPRSPEELRVRMPEAWSTCTTKSPKELALVVRAAWDRCIARQSGDMVMPVAVGQGVSVPMTFSQSTARRTALVESGTTLTVVWYRNDAVTAIADIEPTAECSAKLVTRGIRQSAIETIEFVKEPQPPMVAYSCLR